MVVLEFRYPSHYFCTNTKTCIYFGELIAKLGFGCTLPEVSQHFYRKQHSTTHTCRNPTYVPGPRDPEIIFSRLFWYLNPGCSWEAFKQPSAGGNIFASGFVMEMKANEQQQRWRGWCWLWLFGQEAMELLAGEGRPGQAAHIGSR